MIIIGASFWRPGESRGFFGHLVGMELISKPLDSKPLVESVCPNMSCENAASDLYITHTVVEKLAWSRSRNLAVPHRLLLQSRSQDLFGFYCTAQGVP